MLTLIEVYRKCGKEIRRIRVSEEMQVKALAEKVGISPATLSRIELGSRTPRPRTIEKIAEVLGVSPEQLLNPDDVAGRSAIIPQTEETQIEMIRVLFGKILAASPDKEYTITIRGRRIGAEKPAVILVDQKGDF